MIRMIQSNSAAQAKEYFAQALAKSDYYINDQELAGIWQGRLAARLGLAGVPEKVAFSALCENRHPGTQAPLTPRTHEARRVGYDINFHCPKSVSILHALSGDRHILDAFQASATETMQAIEADAKAHVRKDGANAFRTTGELVWAQFIHQTARPVPGFVPDPHLHAHFFSFNATWDEAEGRVKACEFGDIKRDMPYYQAQFHMRLADKLMDLGYGIRKTAKAFEIEGVPQAVIDLFSKRTDEIGRIAKEKGITDPDELAELGARTRAAKDKGLSMVELQEAWRAQIEALGQDNGGQTVRFAPVKEIEPLSAQACIDHALLHCFERASVVEGRRILQQAYRYALGRGVAATDIEAAFATDSRIIHVKEYGRDLCTTKEVLAEEKRMVDAAKRGMDKLRPLYIHVPQMPLDGQQKAAVNHILTTPHRVSNIRGAAGAGKTTLMQVAVPLIKAAGKEVIVVAPSADASRGILREAGFAEANTVARLLVDKEMQQSLTGQVLWVDEAGLLGTKDMTAILELAEQQNARVILGGDTRQHASVVRGDALRILNTVAGIKAAEVDKIYRQQHEEYRDAVQDLAKGDIRTGFNKLEQAGFIHTLDPLNAAQTLTKEYLAAIREGKSALVISPTHAQGDAVNEEVRRQLRTDGKLGKKELTAARLQNLNFTEAEKGDHQNFRDGQVVQFTQNAPGFLRGSRWHVQKDGQEVRLVAKDGGIKPLPLNYTQRFSVFEKGEIGLSKGDKVRITHNGFDAVKKRLDNGDMLTVTAVYQSGFAKLRNEKSKTTYVLPVDFGHLDHAYCLTSHAAQGKTVDVVLVYQPASTFPATDAKQFYVSVSRGREKLSLFTEDKEELLQHASRMGDRKAALELVPWLKDRHWQPERDARAVTPDNDEKTKGMDHGIVR